MKRAEIVFPSVLLVGIGGLLAAGIFVLHYPWTVIAFPLGAGLLVCALCAVEIATVISDRSQRAGRSEEPPPFAMSSIAWVFALAPFAYGLGFVFGPAAYLLVYLRANGSSWRRAGFIAALSLLVTWGVFVKLLRVPLPVDPLWLL